MRAVKDLENRIKDAFFLIKEDMALLKNSFVAQKDKNYGTDKKIEVLDNRISSLKEDIAELNKNIKDLGNTKEDIGEIHDLKKDVENVLKEIKQIKKDVKKKPKKEESFDEIKEFIGKEDNLKVVFWVLLFALISVVSLGLYYDWYGIFNEELSEDEFFRVLEVKEGELVQLEVDTKDKDGDNLFITYTTPIDSEGEWQTEVGDVGEYSITVTVSDGKETVSENVKIIVNN